METAGEIKVDPGIVNLAGTWNGKGANIYKGGAVSATLRYRDKEQARIQSVLATHGEKSSRARRDLCRKTTSQARHAVNALSKVLVEAAVRERKGIVAGDVTGILCGKRGRKANQKLHSWMFRLLLHQLGYKCRLAGVPFRAVSERNTSRTCVACGRMHRGGRVHRGLYRCKLYGQYNADCGAAYNMYVSPSLRRKLGVGVVGALARPVVVRWNGHLWLPATRRIL
jgi:putative transposase